MKSGTIPIRRAIISVSDKHGLNGLASGMASVTLLAFSFIALQNDIIIFSWGDVLNDSVNIMIISYSLRSKIIYPS